MSSQCSDADRRESDALPRDISRFKKLYPNGRAVIGETAAKTAGFISTIELIASSQTR